MTPERSHAYRRVLHTLADVGPSKLQPSEQTRIRNAADELLFIDDPDDVLALDALARHREPVCVARRVGRWEQLSAARLLDAVASCGPSRQPAVQRSRDGLPSGPMDGPALDELLAEQIAYYRALAPEYAEYAETAMPQISQAEHDSAEREILAAIDDFAPRGDVLELACGPGTFTAELARHAETLTAVDASPEMISLASALPGAERVRFIRADLFSWNPEDSYDVVFFGFWLSHVPLERFESFWSMVRRCLRPERPGVLRR